MNKISCGVIKDLLPLYAEGLCGQESKLLVEEHMKDCQACRKLYEEMSEAEVRPADSGESLKKIKKEIKRRRDRSAALAALLVFVVLAAVFARLTRPEYIPWTEGLAQVVREGENLYVEFPDGVPRVSMDISEDEDGGGRTACIYAWGTKWDRMVRNSRTERVGIRDEDRVYYCWEAEGENTVLLHKGTESEGGLVVLPRLVLGYYMILASLGCALFGILWLTLRKKKAGAVFRDLFFAALAYMAGHLLVKGFDTVSFDAGRDLIFIILAACGVYGILSLGRQALIQQKRDIE